MGIGTSIFLLAVGAILRFAVTATATGVNLRTVGDIFMLIGVLGMILSVAFWSSWGGFGGYARQRPVVVERRSVVERDADIY